MDYTVIDGVIYAETRTSLVTNTLHFLFDENGTRIGFIHNGSDTYYYRFNLQGDVTGIYSSSGILITLRCYNDCNSFDRYSIFLYVQKEGMHSFRPTVIDEI